MHVAMFGCPVPALAHPTFSIAATLVRRGHRVTYVTSERFAGEVVAFGAEVLRCPRIDAPFDQDDREAMPIEHQYVQDLVSLAARTLALTWPFYERNRPDLVLYDFSAFAGLLIAERSGAPAIRMSNQFDYREETLISGEINAQWQEKVLESRTKVNQFLASHHSEITLDSQHPTFYCYLNDLQLRGSIQRSDVLYAARCIAERPNLTRWTRQIPRSKPSALVASSTTYNQEPQYYKNCLLALSRLGWQTVLPVGGNSAYFDSLLPNCQPIEGIPLFSIMPHVDLIICAAGMATAMEAAYHGIPMLMLTSGHPELEAYAQKFQNCGLGIHLSRGNASPDEVAGHAMRMREDGDLRRRVKRLQEAVKRSPGAEDVVNWLEERGLHL